MEYIRGRQNAETQADYHELRGRRINSLDLGGSKAKMNISNSATRPPRQVCVISVNLVKIRGRYFSEKAAGQSF